MASDGYSLCKMYKCPIIMLFGKPEANNKKRYVVLTSMWKHLKHIH